MNNYRTTIVFYSPTGTSKKVARAIAQDISSDNVNEIDLTFEDPTSEFLIEDSLTIFAAPVYAGRIASVAVERLKRVTGRNSSAIIVAVYGNRDYDDALVELYDMVSKNGFTVISAGAFIGEHSFSRPGMPVAEGRPDSKDIDIAKRFGKDSAKKLLDNTDAKPLGIKGNRPYVVPRQMPPMAPICSDTCAKDGMCIELCPTNAIFFDEDGNIATDASKCTLCCACVKGCPNNARIFDTPFTQHLHQMCKERKEPELFL